MKNRLSILWIVVLLVSPLVFAATAAAFTNRIEGSIYGPDRLPVENVYVELRNEVDSPIGQTKTNSSGRFTFFGMPGGRYTIRALPLRTNFMEQTQEVYVSNLRLNSSDTAYVDFYLAYNKRPGEKTNEGSPEAIFVQEIPSAAKKLYASGAEDLKKNQDKGFAELEQAIGFFPNYFDALNLLGGEYVSRKDYEKAYPYLVRAVNINPRSSINFYRLGYAYYQLKKYPAALEAAKGAATLVPDSIDAQQLYGTTLRINGNFAEAETTLLKADSLAKSANPEIHWQLALLYNRLNRNQDAVRELETFLKLEPNSPDKNKIEDLIGKLKTAGNSSK
ncbi:MAG: carboxypeptidase regulatory-like domain-containing protein [Pyrinomonadaceae bacterium]